MKKDIKQHKAGRIGALDLAAAARQGVERALAARQAMTELTPEETMQVSGAATAAAKAIIKEPPVIGLVAVKEPTIAGFRPPIVVGLVATDQVK